MIDLRISGLTLLVISVVGSAVLVATGFQNIMATAQITDGNTTAIEFMAIQHSESGSISPINATTYTLELGNVSDKTILFSDRPARIVTSVSTSDFVGNWTAGPNNFESDVPNDVLIVENTQTGNLETAVIESFNPIYDANTNTLAYTILAENGTSMNIPSEFGKSVLVIDNEKSAIFTTFDQDCC